MGRATLFLACVAMVGCLGVGGGDFEDGDDTVVPDADSDVDADTDSDTGEEPWTCPAYPQPAEGYGMREGDVLSNITLPGNGPDGQTWSMQDFWCMAQREEEPATVLVMDVHSMTCGICLRQAAPELEQWWIEYGARGLVPVGVSIRESLDAARGYWEGELGHTHPWAADPGFATAGFFEGPVIGTPAYVVVDLSTMQIVATQQGFSGQEEALFTPFLR